jgi:hypothetical protein
LARTRVAEAAPARVKAVKSRRCGDRGSLAEAEARDARRIERGDRDDAAGEPDAICAAQMVIRARL